MQVEQRTEYVHARVAPTEKHTLHELAHKHGGLSGALRYLINEHAKKRHYPKNDKSAATSEGDGALVTATN